MFRPKDFLPDLEVSFSQRHGGRIVAHVTQNDGQIVETPGHLEMVLPEIPLHDDEGPLQVFPGL
jgi:hypothetical protein